MTSSLISFTSIIIIFLFHPSTSVNFLFSTNPLNINNYDFSKISVLATTYVNRTVIDIVHKNKKKIVPLTGLPKNLTDIDERHIWIRNKLDMILENRFDGINIDYESAIKFNSSDYFGMNEYIKEIYLVFKTAKSSLQITIDVAWNSHCIDDRCYDYELLYKFSDYLIVMAYDEQSEMFTRYCIASPNSNVNYMVSGIYSYIYNNIPKDHLIIALPWYGYIYNCTHFIDNLCQIKSTHWKNVTCSDAAGTEINYSFIINNILKKNRTIVQFDIVSQTPFFNRFKTSQNMQQIWFDNENSLSIKIDLIQKMKLAGVGVWEIDAVDYQDPETTNDMWSTLPKL
ncbi:hypothetical protein SNEBB_004828 [Seison nebaliae]|nr:hypothetical protein SNEBB_004828 [Seison nebaliae]